jgi:hypothetical protein
MSRPKNPTEKIARKRNRPSPRTRQREDHDEFVRTIPGRRVPENEGVREQIVNEDDQTKVVNENEDNAQSRESAPPRNDVSENDSTRTDLPDENDRIEAADDNSEVHPRSPKVN